MTHAEFETLTGKKIDADVYRDIVEPAYMATSFTDKEKFAAAWNTQQHMGIINDLVNQVEGYAKSYRALADEKATMGYFLADQAELSSSSALRAEAIKIMGEKDYLSYKIRQGYNLWEADRKILLDILD